MADDASFPPEVSAQLERQAAAMQQIYLEFSESWIESGKSPSEPNTYSVYFDGKRFYERNHFVRQYNGKPQPHDHENGFDGILLYFGDLEQSTERPAYLSKYSPEDSTDPDRIKKVLICPYVDAAGFYMPERVMELPSYSGIESLVIRYLGQSLFTKVEKEGQNIRLTVRAPDRYLSALRQMDLDQRTKELNRSASPAEFIAKRLEAYNRLRGLSPERSVTFLLDASHGYCIAEREESTAAGQRFVRYQSKNWKYYSETGIWLPAECLVYWYTDQDNFDTFSDEPILKTTLSLTSIRFRPQAKIQFALDQRADYKRPGTVITDRSSPEARSKPLHQVSYTVAGDGVLLRGMAESVSKEMKRGRLMVWFIGINLAVISWLAIIKFRQNRN